MSRCGICQLSHSTVITEHGLNIGTLGPLQVPALELSPVFSLLAWSWLILGAAARTGRPKPEAMGPAGANHQNLVCFFL
jgi:hypothetical protein